jgi:hypothetical protein
MNGATEATLIELLAVAQEQLKQQLLLKKLFDDWKKAGGMGGSGSTSGGAAGLAGSALGAVTKAAGPLGLVLGAASLAGKALSGAFDLMKSIVGKVIEGLGKTVGNLIDFSFQAMQGSTSVAKFVDAFKDLPFFLGTLASIFAKVIGYQEQLLETYRDLTKYGASFSGSLFEMARMARVGYMSMDEFQKIVKEGSSIFSTAMGGVDAGLKTFLDAQSKLMDPNGPYGKGLLGLGIQAGEAGEMLTFFMKMQGNMNKVNKQSTDQMASGVHDLLLQTDALAKLTGESRENLEKEMREKAADAKIKAWLSSLKTEDAQKAAYQLTTAMKTGGKGLYDDVAVTLMTNGKIRRAGTEASNALYVQTRGMSDASRDNIVSMKNFKLGSEEMTALTVKAGKNVSKGVEGFANSLGGPGMLSFYQFQGALDASSELMDTYTRYLDDGVTAEERAKLVRDEQIKQGKGDASNLASMQLKIRQFGNTLGDIVLTFLKPFGDVIGQVTNWLLDYGVSWAKLGAEKLKPLAEEWIPKLMTALGKMMNWINETVTYLQGSKDITEFWSRLGEKMVQGVENIWKKIEPAVMVIWGKLEPLLIKGFTKVLDMIVQALKDYFNIGETSTDKEWKSKTQSATERQDTFGQAFRNFLEQQRDTERQVAMANPESAMYAKSDIDIYKEFQKTHPEWFGENAQRATALPVQKATGSWGTTGKLIENFGTGTPAELHGKEGVITEDQLNQIMAYAMKSGGENKLGASIDKLNMLTGQVLAVQKEIADTVRKNVEATKRLGGNLFA